MQISAESPENLLAEIKTKKWWQGALISGKALASYDASFKNSDWWVIASQTCNLYNSCFENVPDFEVVAGTGITECNPAFTKGDHPRVLHTTAQNDNSQINLEIKIHDRKWCSRKLLAALPSPSYKLKDANPDEAPDWIKKQWLDKFVGWISRSYTRITLPDAFNEAIQQSKIDNILKNKLSKHGDKLYGIYLSLNPDDDTPHSGTIGEMPSPYLLSIVLVVNEDVDPDELKEKLLKQLFEDEIQDPENSTLKLTRVELAKRNNVRIIKEDIEAKNIAEVTLKELKHLVRYSFVDHLSSSSMEIQ